MKSAREAGFQFPVDGSRLSVTSSRWPVARHRRPSAQNFKPATGASRLTPHASRLTALVLLLLTSYLLLLTLPAVGSAQEYAIGARDVLKITVWGQQDLSQNYNVSSDGMIVFPLIGEVRAAGLTVAQLGQKLAQALEKDYLVNPQVLVAVAEYKSKKVLVLGEIEKAGSYPLTGVTTILEVVSQAGGFSKSGGKQLILVRPQQQVASAGGTAVTGNTIKRLNIDKIQAGDSSENILVEDGDTIFIPKQNAFFVLGEVKSPGTYPLEKDGTSILEAVTIAGGFTQKSAPAGTKVIRKHADGRQETLPVDLSGAIPTMREFKIQDGDSVLVPRGNTFFVFGEVKKPGDYQLEKDTTILEAISIAGGFTDKAAPGRAKIIRNTDKGQQTIDVDMNEIIKRGRREKSVPLKENDVIVVPEAYF
jgi:polysaccharide export outer membrane protein